MERRERAGRVAIEGEMATRFIGGMAASAGDVVRRKREVVGWCRWCDEVWPGDDDSLLKLARVELSSFRLGTSSQHSSQCSVDAPLTCSSFESEVI